MPIESGGAIYFEVASWPEFGAISGYDRETMLALAAERGGNPDDPNKRDPLDFVLWQPSAEGEPAWDSLWGPGRPGWHIECSALALRELGTTIDLHGGGSDLIFPHHECEAAQSSAATGQAFVRHWMHQAMVRMDGEKMSKSLGNLVFVSELRKDYDTRAIRLAIVANHYRTSWEWNDELMPAAAARLERWLAAGEGTAALDEVRAALDNDLDTPAAVAAIDAAAATEARGISEAADAARGRPPAWPGPPRSAHGGGRVVIPEGVGSPPGPGPPIPEAAGPPSLGLPDRGPRARPRRRAGRPVSRTMPRPSTRSWSRRCSIAT